MGDAADDLIEQGEINEWRHILGTCSYDCPYCYLEVVPAKNPPQRRKRMTKIVNEKKEEERKDGNSL